MLPAGTSAAASGLPAATGAGPLAAISYSLIRDSSGTVVAKGDTVTLTFGPSAAFYFLATSSQYDLGIVGTWSFTGGKLTVKFSDPSLTKSGTFALNLKASQARFPFQVFSSKPGYSIWEQTAVDPITGAFRVADSVSAATANGLSATQIVSAAGKYVAGITGAKLESGPGFTASASPRYSPEGQGTSRVSVTKFRALRSANGARHGSVNPRDDAATKSDSGLFDSVVEGLSGLLLDKQGQASVDVMLIPDARADGPAAQLQESPLVSDPRAQLSAKPPGISTDDPLSKSALFIEPFLGTAYVGFLDDAGQYLPGINYLGDVKVLNAEVVELVDDKYNVHRLIGKAATVTGIIAALKPDPGVLILSTHGGDTGTLVTANYLGTQLPDARKSFAALVKSLPSDMPKGGLGIGGIEAPGGMKFFATLTPIFWSWMESSRALDLSRSLVFVSACDTDATPALRLAMKARAYFAFSRPVDDGLATAAERYILDMLSRPTVTAEEIYYNMLRIDQTHQLIYLGGQKQEGSCLTTTDAVCDDRAFIGNLTQTLTHFLYGYGDDGGGVIPYFANGWLSPRVDHGQIFWLTFASRWTQDTKVGVQRLEACWTDYWSHGELGGLSSPFCQNANDGSVPKRAEVDYAIYLVSGKAPGSVPGGKVVPRFTLNDGR